MDPRSEDGVAVLSCHDFGAAAVQCVTIRMEFLRSTVTYEIPPVSAQPVLIAALNTYTQSPYNYMCYRVGYRHSQASSTCTAQR